MQHGESYVERHISIQGIHLSALLNYFGKKKEALNIHKMKYYLHSIRKKYQYNPRALFRMLNRTVHRNKETKPPPHSPKGDLANEFNKFIKDQIPIINKGCNREEVEGFIETLCID